MSNFLQPHGLQHARLSCPSLSPGVCSDSCPLRRWYYLIIHVARLSSCPQSFPASGAFPVSWLFASGGQIIEASASAWVLSMNIQGWRLLRLPWLARRSNQSVLREINSEYSFSAYYYDNLPRVPTGKCINTYRFWTLFLLKISTTGPQFWEFIDILEGERRQGPLTIFSHFSSPPSPSFSTNVLW